MCKAGRRCGNRFRCIVCLLLYALLTAQMPCLVLCILGAANALNADEWGLALIKMAATSLTVIYGR